MSTDDTPPPEQHPPGSLPPRSGGEPPPDDPPPPDGNDSEGIEGQSEDALDPEALDPEALAAELAREARREKWVRYRRKSREYGILVLKALLVVCILTFVIFFDRIVKSIYPGELGVKWSRFGGGTVLDRTYGEGMYFIWPWDEWYVYDMREQELKRETLIYARNGLEITVESSTRFHPTATYLPRLHQEIGPDYVNKVIAPEIVSTLRTVLGNYTPEMIYAKDEQGLLEELGRSLRDDLNHEAFTVSDFLVMSLRLPVTIEQAIKDKLTKEQEMLSYRFQLETEKDEKERRIIEAEGIKAFETISGVPILKWRGIEATEKFANSPNAKIILMGGGEGQLPVILNADSPTPPPAPVAETQEPVLPTFLERALDTAAAQAAADEAAALKPLGHNGEERMPPNPDLQLAPPVDPSGVQPASSTEPPAAPAQENR